MFQKLAWKDIVQSLIQWQPFGDCPLVILLKFNQEHLLEKEYVILQPDTLEEEFWAYANEDADCELIDGVLVIHSPASETHEDIFRFLINVLGPYLDETREGRVYGSRFVMRLSPTWNPEPDLFIVKQENLGRITEGYCQGPGDLVIEILSKATRELDLTKKVPKYLEAGVKEVWIVDPEAKSLIIKRKDDELVYADPNSEEKVDSIVIPNFKLKIKWIWRRKRLSTFRITEELLKANK